MAALGEMVQGIASNNAKRYFGVRLDNFQNNEIPVRKDRDFFVSVTVGVFHSHLQNGLHMLISQGVPNVLTLPSELDQMHLLE